MMSSIWFAAADNRRDRPALGNESVDILQRRRIFLLSQQGTQHGQMVSHVMAHFHCLFGLNPQGIITGACKLLFGKQYGRL